MLNAQTMRFVRNVALLLIAMSSTAQGVERDKDKDRDSDRDKSLDYRHELIGTFSYNSSRGNLKTEATPKDTAITTTVMDFNLAYGYLLGDAVEPFFEVDYENGQRTTAEYSNKEKVLRWGVGALFNIPMTKIGSAEGKGSNSPSFSASTLIPYGGIVMAAQNILDESGVGTPSTNKDVDMLSKIIIGLRYVPYPHIAMHFSLRLSFQRNNDQAQTDETFGGSSARTTIEARLFAVSLLL